ncbi:phosphatidate cytidylyltransferase [Chitinophaga varians]|uniref:Phosphatidate cytidylyltransferase n=1 Tax=Chitinophaga varians TaxID=2202339 RepID=A0A847RZK4_9BACT|nr:phosphatidate cytidylyltransferase [Chitinophaga varians]NLR68542.1 phosphatidate cytidylyltransferase [Chitinophaga varians]
MKKLTSLLLVMMIVMMTSCEVVGGIFKAGVWTGIIIVAVVIALIIWLISRGTRKN